MRSKTLLSLPPDGGNKTPTRSSFGDAATDESQSVVHSKDTLTVSHRISPAHSPSPSRRVSSRPGTAEDSDTDFQSAYSASPRGSYASFESRQGLAEADGDDTIVNSIEDKQVLPATLTKIHRERISSTATAIGSTNKQG